MPHTAHTLEGTMHRDHHHKHHDYRRAVLHRARNRSHSPSQIWRRMFHK